MASAVHKAGGRIILQLAHAGCHANSKLTGQEAWGPSIMTDTNGPLNRAMTREDIRAVIDAFVKAAARAEKAGFDGVQIHAAHGYLLSQFLSPFYNRRNDEYGGSLENRVRIVLEVFESIRGKVGSDYPVMIKMNAQDFVEGGLNADEAIEIAAILDSSGIDAIELSGGTLSFSGKLNPIRSGKLSSQDEEVFYRKEALKYKEKVRAPTDARWRHPLFRSCRAVGKRGHRRLHLTMPPPHTGARSGQSLEVRRHAKSHLPFRQPMLSSGDGGRRNLLCGGEKEKTEE